MKKPIKALPPELFALQNVLDGIEELKKSDWFNRDKDIKWGAYLEREEALDIVKDLCVKKEMETYETNRC